MPIGGSSGGLSSAGPGAGGGAQGPQGATGSQGPQGHQGFQGNQGTQGSGGAQGSQGNQGTTGAQGPQGGTSVQDSWIVADASSNTSPITTGQISLSLVGGAGSDLAVDGGDPTRLNVLTDGFYSVSIWPEVHPSADADGKLQINLDYSGSSDFINDSQSGIGMVFHPSTVSQPLVFGPYVLAPRVALSAGQYLGMDWIVTMAAGSLDGAGTDLVVVRVP